MGCSGVSGAVADGAIACYGLAASRAAREGHRPR
jgi:hypothetical protein